MAGSAVLLEAWAHASPFLQEILVRKHVAAQQLVLQRVLQQVLVFSWLVGKARTCNRPISAPER